MRNQLELRFLNQKDILLKIQNTSPESVIHLNENSINGSIDVIAMQKHEIITLNDNNAKKEALL